ncbi:MAG: glycosyltransferase family 2 protein, partial [Anaerolineae bacterium]|nr:glycosyltransferase family 2 protein [Anaerolineae bacterium]
VLASYYVGRNTILVIARNWPGALLRRHWRSILSAQLRIAAAALRNWRGAAARARLRGQLAGLLGIPGALAARRRIQPGRRVSVQSVESLLT